MSACDEFIQKVQKNLPEECSVQDLIRVGIFRSPQAAAHYRTCGGGPSYFKLGSRIMYPREAIVEWLRIQKHENDQTENLCKGSAKITNLPKQARMANCCRT
jgi:hypothetical protein